MTAEVTPIDSPGYRDRARTRRDALVLDHLSLAEGIARQVHRTIAWAFDLDDLIGTARLALVRAATRYRPAPGRETPFQAYARYVIRGAVIDSMRRRNFDEHVLHSSSDDPDVRPICDRIAAVPEQREEEIDRERKRRRVAAAIARLPPRQRELLEVRYGPDEPDLTESGRRIGISPGGAWQMHARAMRGLRRRLVAA